MEKAAVSEVTLRYSSFYYYKSATFSCTLPIPKLKIQDEKCKQWIKLQTLAFSAN